MNNEEYICGYNKDVAMEGFAEQFWRRHYLKRHNMNLLTESTDQIKQRVTPLDKHKKLTWTKTHAPPSRI